MTKRSDRIGVTRRAAALLVALLALTLALAPQAANAQAQTVRLVIDYGDGTIRTFTELPWKKGATVLDAMNAAKAHPRGIDFAYTGSGATGFLTEIDKLRNQGAGSGRKNWLFWVNTGLGDRSFAIFEVQALDVIFWRYAAN